MCKTWVPRVRWTVAKWGGGSPALRAEWDSKLVGWSTVLDLDEDREEPANEIVEIC